MTVFTRTHLIVDGESAKTATVKRKDAGWVTVEVIDGDSAWVVSGTAEDLTDFLVTIADRIIDELWAVAS